MSTERLPVMQDTLDLSILKAIGDSESHGLGISRRIEQMTRGAFHVEPGSLFPAFHRMDEACWLSSHWGEPENNRRAKYYCLSKRQLKTETDEWKKVVLAMADALKAT